MYTGVYDSMHSEHGEIRGLGPHSGADERGVTVCLGGLFIPGHTVMCEHVCASEYVNDFSFVTRAAAAIANAR